MDREGVIEPELFVDTSSGDLVARGAAVSGRWAAEKVTNAFYVWVSARVLVVSGGVEPGDRARVARAIRTSVEMPALAIVFAADERAYSEVAEPADRAQLARAVAYVCIQCAWCEDPSFVVHVDDEAFLVRWHSERVGPSLSWPFVECSASPIS